MFKILQNFQGTFRR